MTTRLATIARRFFPWVVIDLPLVWLSFAIALVVRGVTTTLEYEPALEFAALASLIVVACNEAFGIYRRWWRFATSQDLVPLSVSVGVATVAVLALDLAWPGFRPMPLSVVFLGAFFAICAMTAVRYRTKPMAGIRRTWRRIMAPPNQNVTRVLIVGAGEAGQHLGWQLQNGALAERYHVVGFVDDDARKHGMLIHSRKVFGGKEQIPAVVERENVDLIVLAIHTITGSALRDIVAICQETSAQIKALPSTLAPIEGAPVRANTGAPLGDSLFGDLTFEDLLGRHSVQIDRDQCRHLVRGKTVLVTGASGSIGSELCRQLADLRPARLVMLDANESGIHDLSVELQGFRSDDTTLVPVVGDVTHERRLRALFAGERPHLVFHTAAYKHVPLMEEYPEEAVRVNVGGTRLMMRLAGEFGAERFVLVSSDKAVEPSSVMGASKRVCELIGTSMRAPNTLYTAVRFGNVLGSRGSVVPTFTKQIDLGGPVTITDPTMSRYFMTISEAASLIVQAANFTTGNDVFLLDMGEEINILDLARRLIRLRGLRPDIDIPIVITGPRPGEKLREVLHSAEEYTQPTPHPQVMRVLGIRRTLSQGELAQAVDDLAAAGANGDRTEVRRVLWQIARDGAAPPQLPTLPAPAAGAHALGTGASLGWNAVPRAGPTAATMTLTPGTVALPDARAPIQVMVERARHGLADAADRALALEPWYILPVVVLLLMSPAGTSWPALLVVGPWLLRLVRTGQLLAPTPFSVPIGLFAAGGVLGMLITSSPLQGSIRLNGLVASIALYWLIVHHATTQRRLRGALALTLGVAAAGSVLMLFVTAPYLPWGAPGGPLDGLIAATDGLRQLVLGASEALQRFRFRASGVGALATFGLALAIGPALAAARRKTRLACFALVLLFLGVVIVSGSRSSLVSVLALIVVLLGLRYGWPLLATPFVLVGLWLLVERQLGGLGAPDALPLSVKIRFWQNAAAILHDFAFTGVGLGQRAVRDVYEASMLTIGPNFSHAHNAYIQAYLEQGLLGALGLVSLTMALLFIARRAVANARTPLAWSVALSAGGAALVQLFEGLTEVVLLTSVGNVLLMVALGLLVAASRVDRRQTPPGRMRPALEQLPERGVLAWVRPVFSTPLAAGLALVALVTFTLTPLSSILLLNLGAVERARATLTDNLRREDREPILARADLFLRRALAADDRDAAIWRNLAEVSLGRGDIGRGREYLGEARIRTSGGDWYSLYQLGRVSKDLGLWREAALAWREAGTTGASALRSWSQEARGRDQWDRASVALVALAELRPDDPEPVQQMVQAIRRTRGGTEAAVHELRRLAETAPRAPWALLELANLYDELGQPELAAAARESAEERRAQFGR
ncbi:MAG: polysaccharide biosynthesis protein [Chloroflexi bacterium]|nr:polysaccharide biosynthesis protein [Chloroflexota bacterium]